MIQIAAPTILRAWKDGLKLEIPGGWLMRIPQVHVEEAYSEAYVQYFMADGLSIPRAQAAAQAAVQDPFTYGFRASLTASIFHWAKKYAKMYPERLVPVGKKTFSLRGFDPELMQSVHVPGQNYGRNGLSGARKLLMEMGGGSV